MDGSVDVSALVRDCFPSLLRVHPGTQRPVVYLDGPAGSQVPRSVIDAISNVYLHHCANTGGKFASSQETTAMMEEAHQAAADWFGAAQPAECIFGANMTTLTFSFSRALSRTWTAGDRIVVSELDHDGNVTPWKMAARDVGVDVDTVRVNRQDATLDIQDFRRAVRQPRTRLVAFSCASNSVGSRTPIRELVEIAHEAGAEVYLDAVHYAAHDLIDVQAWDADFCVCSAYKFFGPHIGMLWGRGQRLEEIVPYKLRPAPGTSPGKWMTGTQNFAAIAGVTAAIDYLAWLGRQVAAVRAVDDSLATVSRRESLRNAFAAIQGYETQLAAQLLQGLKSLPGLSLYGIVDNERLTERVPTFALNVQGKPSQEVAGLLGQQGIFCWGGDYYAVDVCAALGQQPQGMLRLGLLHTNTPQEIVTTLDALSKISGI